MLYMEMNMGDNFTIDSIGDSASSMEVNHTEALPTTTNTMHDDANQRVYTDDELAVLNGNITALKQVRDDIVKAGPLDMKGGVRLLIETTTELRSTIDSMAKLRLNSKSVESQAQVDQALVLAILNSDVKPPAGDIIDVTISDSGAANSNIPSLPAMYVPKQEQLVPGHNMIGHDKIDPKDFMQDS